MFNIALFVFVIQNKDYVFSKEFIVNVESYTSRVIDEIKQKLYIEELNENNSVTNNEAVIPSENISSDTVIYGINYDSNSKNVIDFEYEF